MELIDCHSHTAFSGHGQGSIADAVLRAVELGLSTYVQTEHLWLPESIDPAHEDSMTREQMDVYLAQLHEQREKLARAGSSLELVIGIEADWLEGRADELRELIAPFEYVLGSVHYLDGLAIDYAPDVGVWPAFGVDETWRRYFEAWLEMVSSGVGFTAFSHPDLPKKYGMRPSFDVRPYYEEMAHAVAACGCMVEVNTAGLRKPVGELYPSLDLLRAFHDAGIECTVGADAHCPDDIARGIPRAYELMRQAGYEYVAAPRPDGSRRYIKLED